MDINLPDISGIKALKILNNEFNIFNARILIVDDQPVNVQLLEQLLA